VEAGHSTIYYRNPWGDRLEIVGWEKQSAVLFAVVHTQWPDPEYGDIVPTDYDQHLNPVNAILDERTWQRRPKRLRSLTVVLDRIEEGAIEFVEGYNTNLTLAEPLIEGNRVKNQITIDMEPGNGAGIYPGCQTQLLPIKQINDTAPTAAGDFYMTGTDCYWARRQLAVDDTGPSRIVTATPALLQVGNDCGPCCACAQFESTGVYMNNVRNQYNTTGEAAEQTRDQYHDNRNRWNAGKCCFDQHLLRLQMQAQICPHVDVLGQFVNWTEDCIDPLRITFDFSQTPYVYINSVLQQPTATIVNNLSIAYGADRLPGRRSGQLQRVTITGSWPIFTYTFHDVEPYQNVWVKYRLYVNSCGVDDGDNPIDITCNIGADINGVPVNIPCGAEFIQISSISGSSVSGVSSLVGGDVIVTKTTTLRCPPDINDLYDPTSCYTRAQIFSQINPSVI
jgi:hypothetical protein